MPAASSGLTSRSFALFEGSSSWCANARCCPYKMNLKILLLPGDGIGTEVTSAAVDVLNAVAKKFGHTLELSEGLLGGIAIHKTGGPFPKETEALAQQADA